MMKNLGQAQTRQRSKVPVLPQRIPVPVGLSDRGLELGKTRDAQS